MTSKGAEALLDDLLEVSARFLEQARALKAQRDALKLENQALLLKAVAHNAIFEIRKMSLQEAAHSR